MDSYGIYYLINDYAALDHSESCFGSSFVTFGNGDSIPIVQIGHSFMSTYHHNHLFLKNVLHALDLSRNFLFVHTLYQDNNALVQLHANSFCVKEEHTRRVMIQGKLDHGLYHLKHAPKYSNDSLCNVSYFLDVVSSNYVNNFLFGTNALHIPLMLF